MVALFVRLTSIDDYGFNGRESAPTRDLIGRVGKVLTLRQFSDEHGRMVDGSELVAVDGGGLVAVYGVDIDGAFYEVMEHEAEVFAEVVR